MKPTGQRFWSVAVSAVSVTAAAGTIRSFAVGVIELFHVVSMKPTPDAIDGDALTWPNSINTPPRARAMRAPLRNRFERHLFCRPGAPGSAVGPLPLRVAGPLG